MSFLVTSDQLSQLVSSKVTNVDDLVSAINQTMEHYSISDQPRRVRYFVAQSFYESASYTTWSEDLTYTEADRLVAVWPTRFTLDQSDSTKAYAPDYVSNPQALGNLVYAGRYGNGDVASGDGYNFRGRGAFDLTFRSNYQDYSNKVYGNTSIVDNPDLVAAPADAFMSAGWFWDNNNLSPLADADQFTKVTTDINGSADTVPQRLQVLNRVNSILQW